MSRREAEQELDELRARYREKFSGELDSLAQLVADAEQAGPDRDRLAAIRARAHRLMGTSGSFGLLESSAALARLEARVDAALATPGGSSEPSWPEIEADLAAARSPEGP